jgi:hypothetical protein
MMIAILTGGMLFTRIGIIGRSQRNPNPWEELSRVIVIRVLMETGRFLT